MGVEVIIGGLVSNIVILAWEHWLGKTTKVDANSTASFIKEMALKLYDKIRG